MCKKDGCNCFRIDHWQDGHGDLGVCTTATCRTSPSPPKSLDCHMAPGAVCERCGQYWIPADVTTETLVAMQAEFTARGIRPADGAFDNRRKKKAA